MFFFDYFVKKQDNNSQGKEYNNSINNDQVNINIESLKNLRSFDQITNSFEFTSNNPEFSLDERKSQRNSLDDRRQQLNSLNENIPSKTYINNDLSSLDDRKDLSLNKEMESDLESNNTFKSNESNKTTNSKTKTPHQLRYMNTLKKPVDNIKNNESVKFFENIVEGEYKRKELYTSEQYEGWCPILTNSNINKKII